MANRKILVVDDDVMTLRLVEHVLTSAGHTPLSTSEPEQAARLAAEGVAVVAPGTWRGPVLHVGLVNTTDERIDDGLLLDVVNGRVTGAVSDYLGVAFAAQQMPDIKIAQRIRTGEQYAFMLPKGSDKLEAINDALSAA